jgi:thiol:disulfide interchange protein
MKNHMLLKALSLSFSLITTTVLPALAADQPKAVRPTIYDTKADGGKQIAEALTTAKREHKNVLLQFGANWCGWCHKLHNLFQSDKDIAAFLKANYVLVLVDVDKVDGKQHNADINERYGDPCRFGLPALVVLDADGKQLTTQDSGKLEEGDHHDPAKVLAFLKQSSPTADAFKEGKSSPKKSD